MKKIFNLLFIGIALAATSCSELPEYELPYELSPVSAVDEPIVTITAENAVCPGPSVSFTVDSEATVYYVVRPSEDEVPTSREIWEDGDTVSFNSAGTADGQIGNLSVDQAYTLYAVTVNENGTRSEEVTSIEFSTPTLSEVVEPVVAPTYLASPSAFGAQSPQFLVNFTPDESTTTFSVASLWGPNWVAWAANDATLAGAYPYPGTITIHDDFTVTVSSEVGYAGGGEGTYDPCTGTFEVTILTSLFGDADPETEEVEPIEVDVIFTAYEVEEEEGEGEEEEEEGEEGEGEEEEGEGSES